MQVLGLVVIRWNGRLVPVEKGAKVKLGGMKQMPIVYGRQIGRAQEWEASEITAVTSLQRGQSIDDFYAVAEGELQVQCDTGQSYVFSDAFLTDRLEITGGEGGKIELKWAAGDYRELLNG